MFESVGQINFLAVLASIVASFFLGGLWYVVVIAKQYKVALGRQNVADEKPGPLYMFGPVVCNMFVVLTSAILIQMLKIDNLPDAIAFGLLVGIGYLLSTVANVAINPNFPRPFMYLALNAPYFLLSSLMTSAIIVMMH